jgi:hypothetical protein
MNKKIILSILSVFIINFVMGQLIIIPIPIGKGLVPEHGFLPGSKFKFYPTINTYDFKGFKLRVEVYDDRENVKLTKTHCSDLEFTNTSEFTNSNCIFKVSQYVDTLLEQSRATLDSTSTDTLQVKLEGIDARLIGFGYVRVHGLCQIKVKYHNITKIYCSDITDADKNSPISPNALVSRKTATRIMASASIREVIEQFFVDLDAGSYK